MKSKFINEKHITWPQVVEIPNRRTLFFGYPQALSVVVVFREELSVLLLDMSLVVSLVWTSVTLDPRVSVVHARSQQSPTFTDDTRVNR